ncbi:hypothetical protein AUC71_06235 [Methyloceanibacter marginalis]|uniref:Uncharacterized protein n=1 Tax=Methyloceanibacter marginalis TaxID=1774971 RepID=A0A1E3WE13_9HYPH|nr:hypothetical protein [Methyloceanibacter marginalis]ODS04044.1 hypothetical protein AUC71_06235 [Methyloceanibacter marginalis]
MFVLDIIILVLLIIVMFYSPTYRGVNRANQVLDSKLDKLLSRSDASAGTEQLAEALGEIRAI